MYIFRKKSNVSIFDFLLCPVLQKKKKTTFLALTLRPAVPKIRIHNFCTLPYEEIKARWFPTNTR
jgi:hypothetical protein